MVFGSHRKLSPEQILLRVERQDPRGASYSRLASPTRLVPVSPSLQMSQTCKEPYEFFKKEYTFLTFMVRTCIEALRASITHRFWFESSYLSGSCQIKATAQDAVNELQNT